MPPAIYLSGCRRWFGHLWRQPTAKEPLRPPRRSGRLMGMRLHLQGLCLGIGLIGLSLGSLPITSALLSYQNDWNAIRSIEIAIASSPLWVLAVIAAHSIGAGKLTPKAVLAFGVLQLLAVLLVWAECRLWWPWKMNHLNLFP